MEHRIDPQQEIYTVILVALKEAGYDVYEGRNPKEGTPYPFIMLGDNEQEDRPTKTAILGTVDQRIHVWSNNQRARGTHSSMMAHIKEMCRRIERSSNFRWHAMSVASRTISDTTTSEVLLHGIIDIVFHFS